MNNSPKKVLKDNIGRHEKFIEDCESEINHHIDEICELRRNIADTKAQKYEFEQALSQLHYDEVKL